MSREGNNIRIISRYKQLRDKILEAQQKADQALKAAIEAKRGIGYFDGSSQTGTPGVTKPNNSGNINGSRGSLTQGGNVGGSDGSVNEDVERDGDDLLDGTNEPAPGGDVGTLQLKDCDTGERIDVNFNNGEAEGERLFKHPEGFNEDGSLNIFPDNLNEWVSGTKWIYNSGGVGPAGGSVTITGATIGQAAKIALQYLDDHVTSTSTSYYEDYTSNAECSAAHGSSTTTNWSIKVTGITSAANIATISTSYNNVANCNSASSSTVQQELTIIPVSCTPDSLDPVCPITEPDEVDLTTFDSVRTTWPEGTVHQLSWSNSGNGFYSSSLDPNIPTKWNYPVDDAAYGPSKLNLCTPDGVPVAVEHLSDGSFVYFARDIDNEPDTTTAPIKQYTSEGKYKGILSKEAYNNLQ